VASASHKDIPTVYAETEEASELKEARVGATTPQGSEAQLSGDYSAPSGQPATTPATGKAAKKAKKASKK
jgi:hypothetical protein